MNKVKRFDITEPVRVLLIAVGEGVDGRMIDYGWLENEDTGKTVWEMTYRQTEPAGGARKNRQVRTTISLPKGAYALHFETDGSHAFGTGTTTRPISRSYGG